MTLGVLTSALQNLVQLRFVQQLRVLCLHRLLKTVHVSSSGTSCNICQRATPSPAVPAMLAHDAHQFDPNLLSSLYVNTCDAGAANG